MLIELPFLFVREKKKVLNYPRIFKINSLNSVRTNCHWLVKLVERYPQEFLFCCTQSRLALVSSPSALRE